MAHMICLLLLADADARAVIFSAKTPGQTCDLRNSFQLEIAEFTHKLPTATMIHAATEFLIRTTRLFLGFHLRCKPTKTKPPTVPSKRPMRTKFGTVQRPGGSDGEIASS